MDILNQPHRHPMTTPDRTDDTLVRFCIPSWALPYVTGALEHLIYTDTWTGAQSDREATARAFESMIAEVAVRQCGDDMPFYMRQDPADPCVLQYSTDGTTWLNAFDYTLCAAITGGTGVAVTNIEQVNSLTEIYNQYINHYTTIYDGTPGSIVTAPPSRPALCWAYRAMVGAAIEGYIAYVEEKEDASDGLIDLGAVLLGAAAAAIGFFAGGPAGSYGFASAVLGAYFAVTSGILVIWSALDTANAEALRDYVDQVVCAMVGAAAAATPTYAEYQTLLSGASSDDPDLQKAYDVVAAALTDEDAYVLFLGWLEELRQYEAFLPDCLCDDWCRYFAFGTNNRGADGWTIHGGTITTGSVQATEILSGKQYVRMEYNFTEPVTINGWQVVYTLYNSSQERGAIQFFIGGTEITSERSNFATGIDRTQSASGRDFLCDRVFVFIGDTEGTSPASVINTVTLHGAGAGALPWAGGEPCS